jgi:hypothetical protein
MVTRSALEDLAQRVSRLVPSHRDPERFHLDKSEIVEDIRRLSQLVPDRSDRAETRPKKRV